MNLVLDAGAIIAWMEAEDGAEVVERAILGARGGYIHVLNVTEVFYGYHRRGGNAEAQNALALLESAGVQIVTDMNMWQQAARLKSDWRRISLADCFGVALAMHLNADFLTTDRHELERLEAGGVASIQFIR